jgi:hypothetical protein
MKNNSSPDIQSFSGKDYTSITFFPDFKLFGM